MNMSNAFTMAHYASINGINIAYYMIGSGHKTVLMLHGWNSKAEHFRELIDALYPHLDDYTYLILDLPGFGKSDMIDSKGWDSYDYMLFVDAFLAYKHCIPDIIIGHSNGGRIALRLIQMHSEWVNTRLILIGSAGIKTPKPLYTRFILATNKYFLWIKKILPARVYDMLRRKLLRAHDYTNTPDSLKNTMQKLLNEDCMRYDIASIQNKTLILWGKNDTYTPLEGAHIMHKQMMNSTLKVYNDGRHGIYRTHSSAVKDDIMEWL